MAQEPALMSLDAKTSAAQTRDDASELESPRTGSWRPRLALVLSRAVMSVAALMLLAAAGLYSFRTAYTDKIYPSVYIADVDVGGLTYSEAKNTLEQRADSVLATRIAFTFGGQRWYPTLEELGVAVDLAGSLDSAFDVGRETGARDRVSSVVELIDTDRVVPLRFTVDDDNLNAWFDQVDADLGTPARNASLSIRDGRVAVVPEFDGTVVDRVAARAVLIASLQSLVPHQGALPTVIQAATIRSADLEPARLQVATALDSTIKLSYGKKKWSLTGNDLDEFITLSIDPDATGTGTISVTVDEDALAGYLSALLRDEVDKDPRNAIVAWDYDSHGIFSVKKSANGARLKPLTLSRAVIEAFWGDEKTVKVPTTVIKPDVDSSNLDALGITTRLGVGDSNFDGSDYGRATNVQVGSSLLNGTLVPPGGEFSFNYSIGEITADLGYVEAGVVDGERIGKDIGGGICQVSTTVFRAAFYAGLPITEWNPHRYRLGFYEQDGWSPGLDASILQPEEDPLNGGDFKFLNPSADSWLLVESYVDGPRVYVIIYGPDLGYTVDISGPMYDGAEYPPTDDIETVDDELPSGTIQQTEYELSGLGVAYQRTVYDKDGNLLWDRTFATHFYPRGNVYKVSPDMKGQSPAARNGD